MACLCDARKAATAFLRENAELIGKDGKVGLENAATLYEKEAVLLASQEWHKKSPDEFRELLLKAAELETEAIGQIERALKADSWREP
jgi:hypothetical protein